mmetsp:Transcript_8662/g.27070  ORF Transcript_8662/g.27070 Transcript_8662/m.27070 type:complete len:197 (+) Transcript_8662:142-732(+)
MYGSTDATKEPESAPKPVGAAVVMVGCLVLGVVAVAHHVSGISSPNGALYVKTSDPSQMGLCFSLIVYYHTHTLGAKTSTCTTQYECSVEHPPTDMSLPGASLPDVYSWVPIDDCNADSTGEDGKMPDKTHAGLRGKSDICKWAWLCDRGVSNTGEIKPAPAVAGTDSVHGVHGKGANVAPVTAPKKPSPPTTVLG